jgi:hypothetical protein
MFSRKHSSGTSSPSSSSHSFSNSFADFLSRFDCQLPLLGLNDAADRFCLGLTGTFGLVLRFRFIMGKECVLELVNPRRGIGDAPLCKGINPRPSTIVAPLTCPLKLGYDGLPFPAVNSLCIRLPCVVDIGTRFLWFTVARKSLV